MSFACLTKRAGPVLFAGAFCLLVLPANLSGQERWEWPEKPENLKVLPKDWTGQRLRPIMFGFTRSLGVRCAFCHVGEEGQPLSTYDFASDDNPKKDVARAMLRMLDDINEHLKKVQEEEEDEHPVNMWCHTCHRGRPRPMTLAEELLVHYEEDGTDAAIAHYHTLRDKFYGRGSYDFGEGSLNALGYDLLGKDDTESAIVVFKLNVEYYPESPNVYDSLAEAYMTAGDKKLAIENYEKSLELNPKNRNAAQKLEELKGNTKTE